MELSRLLKEHECKLGVKLDFNGSICSLKIDQKNDLFIESSPREKGFYLYAPVGFLNHSNQGHLPLELLAANLFGRETGRAFLAYEPVHRLILLIEYFDEQGLEFEEYERRFLLFIHYMKEWIEKINHSKVKQGDHPTLNKEGLFGSKNIIIA